MKCEEATGRPASPFLRLERLKARVDFLRAARGRKSVQAGFVLQAWNRGIDASPRVGFTCSKKVGNAVARNRDKRRLREVARLILFEHARPGWDYVLIGRAGVTAARPFDDLLTDLESGLKQVHSSKNGQFRAQKSNK